MYRVFSQTGHECLVYH